MDARNLVFKTIDQAVKYAEMLIVGNAWHMDNAKQLHDRFKSSEVAIKTSLKTFGGHMLILLSSTGEIYLTTQIDHLKWKYTFSDWGEGYICISESKSKKGYRVTDCIFEPGTDKSYY